VSESNVSCVNSNSKCYDEINLAIADISLKGKSVLDIGCGTGLLGKALKEKGNRVVGVNISEKEIKIASQNLDKCILFDVTSEKPFPIKEKFDVLLFADIIEHVQHPDKVLFKFLPLLKKQGLVIISVPNIACYNVRLKLLLGFFDYSDFGVLDRTHLRFFTKKSFFKTLKNLNLEIVEFKTTPYFVRPLFRLFRSLVTRFGNKKSDSFNKRALNSKAFRIYARYFFPIENIPAIILPGLFAYQFVVVTKLAN
jgi:2-polyprenyl-3-methyl-5-hydroxy-6-metoxy-1,4-benzoquinol methylase